MFIYGKRPVQELLKSEHPVKRLILARELDARESASYQNWAGQRRIPVEYDHKSRLQKWCGPVIHQGVLAEIDEYHYVDANHLSRLIKKADIPVVLLLDQIQDTHNLGAIIRTSEICGVTAVILPVKTSAAINPTVAKTSAGAIFHIPVCLTSNLHQLIKDLKDHKLAVLALSQGQKNHIFEADLTVPLALVIGSEGKGLRKSILNECDDRISIPQSGRLDSLNVSVSAAVTLFEIMRQRRYSRK